jgi:hypothetical protein
MAATTNTFGVTFAGDNKENPYPSYCFDLVILPLSSTEFRVDAYMTFRLPIVS